MSKIKKKSIAVYVLVSVFIIAAAVLSFVKFPIGLYDYNGYAKVIKLGLDLSGGVSCTYDVGTTEIVDGVETEIDRDQLRVRIEGAVGSMQNLLTSKGYTEAVVSYDISGNVPTIRVEVPDVDDPERIFTLIGRPASLKFVSTEDDNIVYIEGKKHLETAYVTYNQDKSGYEVGLKFNELGAEKFEEATSELSSAGTSTGYMKILVNDEVLMEQVSVSTVISGGNATISNSGGYSYAEAYELATSLQAGTFGVDLTVSEMRILGATLGENAIRNGLIAGGIGLLLVMIFMALYYKKMGLLADLALLIYVELLVIFCSILPWVQLTLPGIAGILLGIGMAVDANIVIFERIKDERRGGKKMLTAIDEGFKKARVAVLDSNITTIIGAAVLWIFGGTAVVGFAVTLLISIIISMFTALVLTRSFLKCALPFDSTDAVAYGIEKKTKEVAENA